MQIEKTKIPGCFEITPRILEDNRGSFVKTFHHQSFKDNGLETNWVEEYYSLSHHGVLRGLHFQTPPHDHTKLVYCVVGQVLDVVLDLRVGSPTFGESTCFDLSAQKANMIYIPSGLAHGFFTLSETATMIYKVSSMYAADNDAGLLWNSAGIEWPEKNPILSARDEKFPHFDQFDSPFVFQEAD